MTVVVGQQPASAERPKRFFDYLGDDLKMDVISPSELPSQTEYLAHARQMEEDCESKTDVAFAVAGDKAPICVANLADLLVNMDAVSSCFWYCLGGNHRLE